MNAAVNQGHMLATNQQTTTADVEPLTPKILATFSAADQKQVLGEHIYPMVESLYPHDAGKITGMLLEMDNAELLRIIASNKLLKLKVDEAVSVLKAHSKS